MELLDPYTVAKVKPFRSIDQLVAIQLYRIHDGERVGPGDYPCIDDGVGVVYPVGPLLSGPEAFVGFRFREWIAKLDGKES